MFFFLSKILSFLLSPLIWIFVLLLFVLFAKKPNRKRNFSIIAFILLFLFSNGFLLNEVLLKWEPRPVKLNKTEKFDYGIVLGGFSNYDTSLARMQLTGAGDRIWQTLRLYKENKISKIFISGGSGKLLGQDITEADKVKTFLLAMKIPEKDIIIEMLSRNTYENAKNTTDWIKKHDPEATCLLITSASHMRRAAACFKKLIPGIKVYPANFNSEPRKYDLDILIKPNAQSLFEWDLLIKEMVGFYIYKVVGYN
jgi:uncharacterized SAM-binding protein YcdF (DUF218 family)